jgi:hypothetical protein
MLHEISKVLIVGSGRFQMSRTLSLYALLVDTKEWFCKENVLTSHVLMCLVMIDICSEYYNQTGRLSVVLLNLFDFGKMVFKMLSGNGICVLMMLMYGRSLDLLPSVPGVHLICYFRYCFRIILY